MDLEHALMGLVAQIAIVLYDRFRIFVVGLLIFTIANPELIDKSASWIKTNEQR